MAKTFRNTWRIHDPDADRVKNVNNTLSIEFLPDGFVFSVMDTKGFRYVALEACQADRPPDMDDYCRALQASHADNPLLNQPFQKVQAAVYTPSVLLVPDSVYASGREDKLFYSYVHYENHKLLRSDPLQIIDAQGIYAVPQPLLHTLEKIFPGCIIKSSCLSMIKNVLAAKSLEKWHADMVLHIRQAFTEILLFDKEKLIFYRSFPTACIDDLLYYVFYVLEQYQQMAGGLQAYVIGELAMDSPDYALLASFFRRVVIPERNDMFRYSNAFENIPCHYYYNLFNLNTCES